jgi:hypothetical protein
MYRRQRSMRTSQLGHLHLVSPASVAAAGNSLTCLHFTILPIKSTVFLGLYFRTRVSPGGLVMAAMYAACSKTSSLSG